jgi:hypothetical protein
MKRKKIVVSLVLAPVLIAVALVSVLFKGCRPYVPAVPAKDSSLMTEEERNALLGLRQVEGIPLYVMEYEGSYDDRLRANIYDAVGIREGGGAVRGCSAFAAAGSDGPLFARNHDFFDAPVLLLYTDPPDGYASVSLVDLSLAGLSVDQDIAGLPISERTKLLYAPFLPCDGMNEHGVAIGTMYVSNAKHANAGAPKIFSLEAIRLVLDHARSTDEAVALLDGYELEFPVLPSHFLISDRSGNSAVVEFVDGEMIVVKKRDSWSAATNFTLHGSGKRLDECRKNNQKKGAVSGDSNGRSYWRYLALEDALEESSGRIDFAQAMELLEAVSLRELSWDVWMTTEWSVVYGLQSGRIDIVLGQDYSNPKQFSLPLG